MKKVLTLMLAAVLAAGAVGNAAAQKIEIGARAGIGSHNMDRLDSWMGAKTHLGWNLAAVSRIRIIGFGNGLLGAGLFFQPEVVYSQNNVWMNRYIYDSLNGLLDTRSGMADEYADKVRVQTVDVPLLLSLKVSLVRVQAGPVFNLMSNFKTVSGDLEMLPLRYSVGYALGASVDLGPLVIDGRYHGDFKKLDFKGDTWDGFKTSFSSWSLGVGIMF